MKRYLGVKIIGAIPMTRLEYNVFRGWKLSEDENGADEGFLVEYEPNGNPNTKEYKGYVSWSPYGVFHEAYRETTGLNFGLAIEALKKGYKVARTGWNGKGMWLKYMNGKNGELPRGSKYLLPFIGMKTSDDGFVPWLASQTDILAEDWEIVG